MNAWIGRLLALGIGLGFVLVLEGILRLVPGLAPEPLVVELAREGEKSLHTVNPSYPLRFFSGTIGRQPPSGMLMAPYPFVEPLPENLFRVIFAGGSTVQGFPHPRRLAAASYLQAMLQDAWPDRQVEVINVGITAVSSFAVARTVEDAFALRPDLVVVYTGHNDFYGLYGAASLRQGGDSVLSKRMYYWLMQLRLTTLLRTVMGRFEGEEGEASESLLQVMSSSGAILPGDPRRERAQENLRENLHQLAVFCRRQDVPLVLCTLASNEVGFAPTSAELPDSTSREERQLWKEEFAQASALLGEEGPNPTVRVRRALLHLERAEAIFSQHALLHYLRGKCLVGLGEHAVAREAFIRARDLDVHPWRAPSEFNQVIRDLAEPTASLLADVEAAFYRVGPEEGIGWELMTDHLHPSLAGEALIARTVVRALRQGSGGTRLDTDQLNRLRNDGEYHQLLGHLPVEDLVVRLSMAELLSEPPMDRGNESQVARLMREGKVVWERLSEGERNGYDHWRSGKGVGLLTLSVADQLFARQQFDRAQRYYRAARREEPFTIWGDLWATLRWGRCEEMLRGSLGGDARTRVEEGIERARFLALAPGFDPTFQPFFMGYARHLLGEGEAAIRHLEQAALEKKIRQQFYFDLLTILCEELVAVGRFDEAEGYVRKIAGEQGQEAFERYLLDFIRKRKAG
jgi:lysophospholipase L1-like esterase